MGRTSGYTHASMVPAVAALSFHWLNNAATGSLLHFVKSFDARARTSQRLRQCDRPENILYTAIESENSCPFSDLTIIKTGSTP